MPKSRPLLNPGAKLSRTRYILIAVVLVVVGTIAVLAIRAANKPADLNHDGTVNIFDLSMLLTNWGTTNATADVNGDGTVSIFDLSIVLSNWGKSGAPVPVANDVVFEWTGDTGQFSQIVKRKANGEWIPLTTAGYVNLKTATGHVGDWTHHGRVPNVTRDGTKIAYEGTRPAIDNPSVNINVIMIMNGDGSGKRILYPPKESQGLEYPRNPIWSPDGNHLVYSKEFNQCRNLYKINADGTGDTKLTDNCNASDRATWSPDGSQIAYQAPIGQQCAAHLRMIYVMNTDGSNKRPIDSECQTSPGQPTWSPDGKRIYAASPAAGLTYFKSTDGFTSNGFSSNGTMARVNVLIAGGSAVGEAVDISPDAAKLIYVDRDNKGLYTVGADGGTAVQMEAESGTSAALNHRYPSWTPDFPVSNGQTLVALGDSVAAGEGIEYGWVWHEAQRRWVRTGPVNPVWWDTTSAWRGANYQDCHQSEAAHPRLHATAGFKVISFACTGALASSGILESKAYDNSVVPAQLGGCEGCGPANTAYDFHNPDVVTLSVGMNDIDFAGWLARCYVDALGCGESQTEKDFMNAKLEDARENLRIVLAELNRRAGNAGKVVKVLVNGYYDPFPRNGEYCVDMVAMGPGEVLFLRNALATMNSNIAAEVTVAKNVSASVNYLDIQFVDMNNVMFGHELCTQDPWIFGPSILLLDNSNPAPYHPTYLGQAAMFKAQKAKLDQMTD